VATAVSAVVFGLFHGVNVVLPAAIVLGILNAALYERSGSIWPAVVAHAVNNTLIFVVTRIAFESGLVKNF
jgi:membrane protease YdiL (CAAX protease family)